MKTSLPLLSVLMLAGALLALTRVADAQPNCLQVTCPTNIVVPCEGPWGAHVSYTVVAVNTCVPGPAPTVTYSIPPGSVFPPGTTMVCATNQIPGTAPYICCFPVTVDTCCGTNCIRLICPQNYVFPCDPATGAGVPVDLNLPQFQPQVSNFCGGPIPTTLKITYFPSPPSGNGPILFPPGENTVIVCVSDSATGYIDCCCYKILVLTNCFQTTATNPCRVVVTCPTNVVVCVTNTPGTTNVPFPPPILGDTCANHHPVISQINYSMPPGSFFPLGKTTVGVCVKWIDDAAGGIVTGTNCCCYDVTVNCCTNPCENQLDCPGDMVLPCPTPAGGGVVLNYNVTGTNSCLPQTFIVCTPPSGTVIFGNTNVCCVLHGTDGASLTQCCFKVTLLCPSNCVPIINCPSNIFVTCPGPRGAYVTYPPITVTNSCGLPVNLVCNPPSGSFFPIGCRPVTCFAVDTAGNVSKCTFKVCVLPAGCYLKDPSFELVVANPQPPNACGGEPIDDAQFWKTLAGTPMLFRPPAGVPANCWGNEVPCDGTNYAGISGGYTAAAGFQTDQMIGQTVVPLSNGKPYRLRACLSLADNSPGPVYVEFVLANKANPAQQYTVNTTLVTQKVGWQGVFAQPPCFVVPQGTNIWDALIIRAAQVPATIPQYPVGQVYIDNVNICCCSTVRIVGTTNPTLTWFGQGTLLVSPTLAPGSFMNLGTIMPMDPDTGMSMIQLDTSFFDVFRGQGYLNSFFDVFADEPLTYDCGCY